MNFFDLSTVSSCLLAGVLVSLAACAGADRPSNANVSSNGCPAAGWNFARWNDAYGLNVVAMIEAEPGWTFAFDSQATITRRQPQDQATVEVVLRPKPIDAKNPPRTADQHIYGYWPHAMVGVKPNWVQVRCGKTVLGRTESAPVDLFNSVPPSPPPTVPPPPQAHRN